MILQRWAKQALISKAGGGWALSIGGGWGVWGGSGGNRDSTVSVDEGAAAVGAEMTPREKQAMLRAARAGRA